MIYINIFSVKIPQKFINEGQKLTEELKKLKPDERKVFIEKHSAYWRKLKDYYSKVSHGKCWYTEAQGSASDYDMDHFRPKSDVEVLQDKTTNIKTTNKKGSYWWLAFDWQNYRYSATKPNKKKKSYFPLKEGTVAANDEESIKNECPVLIDPTNKDDISLITFDRIGNACPACSEEDEASWGSIRAKISIRTYNLNYQKLVEARLVQKQKCDFLISQIKLNKKKYLQYHDAELRFNTLKCIYVLLNLAAPESIFSAFVKYYIKNYQEKLIRNILKIDFQILDSIIRKKCKQNENLY